MCGKHQNNEYIHTRTPAPVQSTEEKNIKGKKYGRSCLRPSQPPAAIRGHSSWPQPVFPSLLNKSGWSAAHAGRLRVNLLSQIGSIFSPHGNLRTNEYTELLAFGGGRGNASVCVCVWVCNRRKQTDSICTRRQPVQEPSEYKQKKVLKPGELDN